jgi:hypothetical protein
MRNHPMYAPGPIHPSVDPCTFTPKRDLVVNPNYRPLTPELPAPSRKTSFGASFSNPSVFQPRPDNFYGLPELGFVPEPLLSTETSTLVSASQNPAQNHEEASTYPIITGTQSLPKRPLEAINDHSTPPTSKETPKPAKQARQTKATCHKRLGRPSGEKQEKELSTVQQARKDAKAKKGAKLAATDADIKSANKYLINMGMPQPIWLSNPQYRMANGKKVHVEALNKGKYETLKAKWGDDGILSQTDTEWIENHEHKIREFAAIRQELESDQAQALGRQDREIKPVEEIEVWECYYYRRSDKRQVAVPPLPPLPPQGRRRPGPAQATVAPSSNVVPPVTNTTAPGAPQLPRRGRGRPLGSKNKPKDPSAPSKAPAKTRAYPKTNPKVKATTEVDPPLPESPPSLTFSTSSFTSPTSPAAPWTPQLPAAEFGREAYGFFEEENDSLDALFGEDDEELAELSGMIEAELEKMEYETVDAAEEVQDKEDEQKNDGLDAIFEDGDGDEEELAEIAGLLDAEMERMEHKTVEACSEVQEEMEEKEDDGIEARLRLCLEMAGFTGASVEVQDKKEEEVEVERNEDANYDSDGNEVSEEE